MSMLQVPDNFPEARVSFIKALFKTMDKADHLDNLLAYFTEDAKVVLEGRSAYGHRELREQQANTWDLIKNRAHTAQKIYANDVESEDLMIFGTISYTLANGTKVGPVGWACRMVIEEDDDDNAASDINPHQQRLSFYQMWMDSSLLKEGKVKDAEASQNIPTAASAKTSKHSFLRRHATISETPSSSATASTPTAPASASASSPSHIAPPISTTSPGPSSTSGGAAVSGSGSGSGSGTATSDPNISSSLKLLQQDRDQRKRTYNFAAGPSPLPTNVLETASHGILNYANTGMGINEISHRSPTFQTLITNAEANFRKLLAIPKNYKILFMQGGGLTQFSAVYLNLTSANSAKGKALETTRTTTPKKPRVDYFLTGTWSSKAIKEASRLGANVNIVADGRTCSADGKSYSGIPDPSTWNWSSATTEEEKPAYIYYCANETIHGIRMPAPKVPDHLKDVPVVADMSSNILSEPIDFANTNYGIIYAGAQKNMGPSGVTLVIIRDDLIVPPDEKTPDMLSYKPIADAASLYNTPPMFSIYVCALVYEELLSKGGVEVKAREAEEKSKRLYSYLEKSQGFYNLKVPERKHRSRMNVVFELRDGKEAEEKFIKEATNRGIKQIKGHRSVGGIRVSLYNAITLDQVGYLIDFLEDFRTGKLASESDEQIVSSSPTELRSPQ